MISPLLTVEDERLDRLAAPWLSWERAVLHDLIGPADVVLELRAGTGWLVTALAARAGWVTAIEEHPARLAHLRELVTHSGWPNITLAPRLAEARASSPFDVLVTPWLASDEPDIRWLSQLAERRLILTGPLDDAALDQFRTSAQALGLDVMLHGERFGETCRRAVLTINLAR